MFALPKVQFKEKYEIMYIIIANGMSEKRDRERERESGKGREKNRKKKRTTRRRRKKISK